MTDEEALSFARRLRAIRGGPRTVDPTAEAGIMIEDLCQTTAQAQKLTDYLLELSSWPGIGPARRIAEQFLRACAETAATAPVNTNSPPTPPGNPPPADPVAEWNRQEEADRAELDASPEPLRRYIRQQSSKRLKEDSQRFRFGYLWLIEPIKSERIRDYELCLYRQFKAGQLPALSPEPASGSNPAKTADAVPAPAPPIQTSAPAGTGEELSRPTENSEARRPRKQPVPIDSARRSTQTKRSDRSTTPANENRFQGEHLRRKNTRESSQH